MSKLAPRGVILVVHGLGDHLGRFEHLARTVNEAGWSLFAFDLPGHGDSPGKPGTIQSFDSVLEDICEVRRTVAEYCPGLPQVLLGHSMGGNFAANYALRMLTIDTDSPPLAGLALCAPMLMPPQLMPRPIIFAAWLTGRLFPWFRFDRKVDPDLLTQDADEADQIRRDPKTHGKISMYLATQLVSQGRWAIDHARDIRIPTLVMYGKEDSMIDRDACDHLAIRIGKPATMIRLPHTRHAIFHDVERDTAIEELTRWLDSVSAKN
ncbi:Phospholipase YtpA [Rubripirellula tenax]|uniref:Phospholipase YtpA n=1 Tax=Rubripirellula tenax TaxID=2528015 RepID=A0A5C6ECZ6_9BACT|nr:alpha/beta hydrolase [Rubripirellula tenax]TWU46334.1 Phospholipase YtpA [Rubripirellula tenax]